MSDYDFKTLNDKEFEIFCIDILGKRDGVRYERFKPGKDGGVDGRYFMDDGGEAIVQCKHWATSPLERLVKYLEEVELPKILKLKPRRYVLVLSHSLSRTDKSRIATLLSPYIISPADVVGREDLNNLLADYPKVELQHYKLWIGSTNVLMHLLNKPIHDRSSFTLEEIRSTAHLYAPTSNHDLAIEKLESLGSVIITGPAGIGKTTLADHLTLHYVAKGFQLVFISDEIREAEAIYEQDLEQIFYFDDFLGRNYLEALSGHEGSHIVQFIKRISKDRKKRFILTSRTTILNQGKLLNDVFQNNNLDRNEFEVTLNSFSEMDKARVFYNHLWHSDLGSEYIDVLYENKRYKEVIRHRNYNPRLIRFITDSERLTNCPAAAYWSHAKALLDNPAKVWENPFEAQHDDFGRALVLLVVLNGRAILQSELSESYVRYTSQPDTVSLQGRSDFLTNLKHLAGSLLTRVVQNGGAAHLNLFNPSIGDYVLHRYAPDLPTLRAGFCSLRSTSSLRTLANLASNRMISAASAASTFRHLLLTAHQLNFVGYSVDYIALAINQLREISQLSSDSLLSSCISFVASSECPAYFPDVARTIDWALANQTISQEVAANFVLAACSCNPMSEELSCLGEIVAKLEASFQNQAATMLEKSALAYLLESVHDEFSDADVFESLDYEEAMMAERNLRQMISVKLDAFGVTANESSIDEIVQAFDIEDRGNEYFKEEESDDDDERTHIGGFHIDQIDDLFERS